MVGSEVIKHDGIEIHFHRAKDKRQKETIVFVHHMWGSHRTTSRHYQFLNKQGYDCVSFDLIFGSQQKKFYYHPYMKFFYMGVFYIWYKQIQSILDFLEGEKILFAFSGPSLAAFWAADGRSDVRKIICDGGPFEMIYENTINFFNFVVGIPNRQLSKMASFFGTAIWGTSPLPKLHRVLEHWNPKVPILSIRGVEDDIVALKSIAMVFEKHPELPLTVVEINKCRHLNGLRDFPDEYKPPLLKFLSQ